MNFCGPGALSLLATWRYLMFISSSAYRGDSVPLKSVMTGRTSWRKSFAETPAASKRALPHPFT
jgi:hypothetical protein